MNMKPQGAYQASYQLRIKEKKEREKTQKEKDAKLILILKSIIISFYLVWYNLIRIRSLLFLIKIIFKIII